MTAPLTHARPLHQPPTPWTSPQTLICFEISPTEFPSIFFPHLRQLVLHRHELCAELLLVEIIESRDFLQPDRCVQLEVRSDLREEDLLLHLLHEELRLWGRRWFFNGERERGVRSQELVEKKNTTACDGIKWNATKRT